MSSLGATTLSALLVLSTWACALAVLGARRRAPALTDAAVWVTYAVAGISTFAVLMLAHAFAVCDFSLVYVQRHVDRTMPLFYRVTAMWGGMEGSLLVWTWMLAVFSALAVRQLRTRLRELMPSFIATLMIVMIFFTALLLLHSDPFARFLVDQPAVGKGLNPLLQNPYMVTHPPTLYLGYTGMVIPFALAIAALVSGQLDNAWVHAARGWAMAAWYFLSVGLVLGMLWAYEELGWGGYWAWDPVENAGLLPWLTATAFLHSLIVQQRRHMLKKWNMVLAVLTFMLTIFGTFLTRSGFVESVHAFGRSNVGYVFLGFLGITAVVGFGLLLWRSKALSSRGELESVMSREFWFLLNNWVLLTAALLVMVLTIFPNLSVLFGDKVTISSVAFNSWMAPIGVALLVLTGVGPMLGWRKSTPAGLKRQLALPVILSALVAAALGVLTRRGLPTVIWGLSALVLFTVAQELLRVAYLRSRSTGANVLLTLGRLITSNRRRYGGYIVHIGVVLMFVGFAGEAFKLEREVVFQRGQTHTIGRYTVGFEKLEREVDPNKQTLAAVMSVAIDGVPAGHLHPARWVYAKHPDMPTTEVALRRSAREDLFVTLGSYDEQSSVATVKIVVNPLVSWIWIGFLVLSVGTAIAAFPSFVRRRSLAAVRAAAVVLLLLGSGAAWASGEPPAGGGGGAAATSGSAHAPHEGAPATAGWSAAESRLFEKLTCMCGDCPQLLLSKCQCGFAERERGEIRAKLALGWDESKVLDWYVKERGKELGREPFGVRVLSVPPDTLFNRLSWLVPYAVSAIAIVLLVLAGRRWARRGGGGAATAPASAAEDAAPKDAVPSADRYRELVEEELKRMDR